MYADDKKTIKAVLFGAGLRGADAYGPYALEHPDQLTFVAVAEPDPDRRRRFAEAHQIGPDQQFSTWENLLDQPKIADAVFNCTQDQLHFSSGMAALDAGYHMLLEKPIAPNAVETVSLIRKAEEEDCLLLVGHVLRFTSFFSTLHDILKSGRLGEIVTVEHRENVAHWHMAHSFVRGNWRKESISSPMILAKCCHDLDVLSWNLESPVQRLQSFGSLRHFREEKAPKGATQRCTDGCPAAENCPFDARRLYLNMFNDGWPVTALGSDLSLQARQEALENGPYGRCVYYCDNDVVDHQTVNMQLKDGTSVVLVMHGHSHQEGRTMRYDGTRATLRGIFSLEKQEIEIHDHLSGKRERIDISTAETSGHGGGDFGIVSGFVNALNGQMTSSIQSRISLESHLLAFAAEVSRHEHRMVDMDKFRASVLADKFK